MDFVFDTALLHDSSDFDEIPPSKDPVWILGKKYDSVRDTACIRADIRTRLWFTYRKGFVAIGDSGPTSDRGWGCMLRCGQMLMAGGLLYRHLGREWRWKKESRDPEYLRILKMFEDKKLATYSIHQIALMGVSEGKDVGQWFGPNTVAQVLKKLCGYDQWSQMAIHVALDNTLVVNDVRALCRQPASDCTSPGAISDRNRGHWKPLLLIIPLRLGLSEINPIYVNGLKTCFKFRQSLGVIGGKPNHALYFIGFVGNEVVYLDPHTTQPACVVQDKEQSYEKLADQTYHCPKASRSNIMNMDPSVAVSFFCSNEAEFEILCQQIQERLVKSEKQPLFEVVQNKPRAWSPAEDVAEEAIVASFANVTQPGRSCDGSEDDFVLLG